jgi:ketosteroid isomerase-like protein
MRTRTLLRVSFCTLAFLLVIGCGAGVNLEAEKAAVKQADADFSKTSESRDFKAFLTFVSDSAAFYSQRGRILRGKQEVGEQWKPLFDPTGPALVWQPTDSDVASAGDLGYTRGVWKISQEGPEGRREGTGKYVTIWRKEADGKWRVVVDIGVPDEQPTPTAE